MRTLSRRAAALTILVTLTLSGCGGSDSGGSSDGGSDDATSSAPQSDVDPATGDEISGDGYAFNAPDGWEKPSKTIPGTEQSDVFVANLSDSDGFADNVNVVRLDPAPLEDLDPLETALVKELEGVGAEDVTIRDRSEIDGDEAVHIASSLTQQGASYLTEQYNAIHDGVSYVVTFSYSPDVSEADRDETAASVLATWKWAS
ncbi:hypothetical protein [Aeromicrobium stalagmiti]|uniref:hypothetical protein n=1 Tax=Aeromicrobium stalagmiti TaxID=2738988 RepID=UPI00156A29DA|nr:hypothetical protein [Aeromicrobium stalagmiti]NRQ48751.1 hypothetical protein [Aeromicrobium stalagmiti]